MADCNNSHVRMIKARVSRAVRLAAGHGFNVDIKGSLLNIRDERSSGLLLFRSDHIVLQNISVDPAERRRHFGSAMLHLAIAIANQAALRLELIADAFNLFNRTNVAAVNQLCDPTAGATCAAGQPTSAYDARQFQFALKLYW